MAELAITNASPLILLSRANHLELLHSIADRVLVPEPVAREVLARGADDVTAAAIKANDRLEVTTPPEIPVVVQTKQHSGVDAVIDDLAGRKCAASLGVPVRGTLGIVLVAKTRGVIPSAGSDSRRPVSVPRSTGGSPEARGRVRQRNPIRSRKSHGCLHSTQMVTLAVS